MQQISPDKPCSPLKNSQLAVHNQVQYSAFKIRQSHAFITKDHQLLRVNEPHIICLDQHLENNA